MQKQCFVINVTICLIKNGTVQKTVLCKTSDPTEANRFKMGDGTMQKTVLY